MRQRRAYGFRAAALAARLLIGLSLPFAVLLTQAAPATARVFDPVTFTLSNGMRVVVVENHRAPIVQHMVWYRVGAADEPAGRSGIAHFLEHLMFKRTENLGPGEFSDIVARNGGRENAFTNFDYTAYFQTVASDRLERMMELEAERMVNLVLSDEDVEPERAVILEERRSRTDNQPGQLLREQVMATLFVNHPYGTPVIGWAHEIETLTREQLMEFYRTWYAPNNAILAISGDVDPEAVRAMAERHYGRLQARELPERIRPQEPLHHAPRRVTLRDERVGQDSMSRRWLAPGPGTLGSEHVEPLELLSEILGGGSTSRLYSRLVIDLRIATGAGAWYSGDNLDSGIFGVHGSASPGTDIAEVEAAIDAELDRVLADGITEDELSTARNRMLAAAIYARDSVSTPANVFGTALTTGQDIDDVEGWPDRISAVTVDQVNAAARAVLVDYNSVTGILLPAAAMETGEITEAGDGGGDGEADE